MEPRVLIADDEQCVHNILKRSLKDRPYRYQDTYNGQQTLDAVRKTPPDLIILDVNMPGKNGLKVLEEIRQNPATKELRIIMISGDPSFGQTAGSLPHGVEACVGKPFEPQRIRGLLDEILLKTAKKAPPRTPESILKDRVVELTRRTIGLQQRVDRLTKNLDLRLAGLERDPEKQAPLAPQKSAASAIFWLAVLVLLVSAILASFIPGPIDIEPVRGRRTGLHRPPRPAPGPAVRTPGLRPPAPVPVLKKSPRTGPRTKERRKVRLRPERTPGPAAHSAALLDSVRVQSYRVTMNTSGALKPRTGVSPDFGSLFIDLPGAALGSAGTHFAGKGRLIRSVDVIPVKTSSWNGLRVKISWTGPVMHVVRTRRDRTVVDFYYGNRRFQ